MDIHVTVEGRHDLAGQIYRQLRSGIIEGRLAGGTRLPSTRELAVQLGVSRKTTLDVFERLLAEGYLTARAGSGTFVATGLQRLPSEPSAPMWRAGGARAPHVPHADEERPRPRTLAKAAPVWDALSRTLLLPHPDRRLRVDFVGGVTDKSRFPFDVWRRCVNQALRAQARGVGAYRDAAGEQELRLAISRYLAFSRAVASNWEDVIVTQGAQHALDLIARVVLRPGDVAAIEDPGYPPARACLLAAGAKLVPVPVDDEGLMVERLPRNGRLVYVTPSHQFPLGMPMSLERRVALLEWAQQRGAVIIEDDYDCEFRFEGRPMEPLKSLDRSGIVAYVGTFSKTIFPELRVGYVVPPASLAQPLVTARKATDWHGCTLTQRALATFMLNGDFARHLRRMHKEYAARREALLAHLRGPLSAWFAPVMPTTAGIHLAARLYAPIDEATLVRAAADVSLGIYGLTPFYVKARPQQGLMFGYGAMDVAHIADGLDALAALMPRLQRSRNGA